jgi:ubiquinone/menaquinone biosynthesis C-methylase UbiE
MLESSATAFDPCADAYDADFTSSALGRVLRAFVFERYAACFPGRERLLEVGCGTGEDAVHLAAQGHRVVATDASAAMLRVAARKAERAGVASRIEFVCLPMERVGAELAGERFDGTYSNFGAVNCVADVAAIAARIAALLSPGAPLVWVPMGRHVPWEWAWFLARANPGKAFRRYRRAGTAWRGLTIHYPAPATLARALAPHFVTRRTRALGFALPPSYAGAWLDRSPRALAALARLERLAQGTNTAARFSDHYIFEAERA